FGQAGVGCSLGKEIREATEQTESNKNSYGQKSDKLDNRFKGYRRDNPLMLLGDIDAARTECDYIQANQYGDVQRRIGKQVSVGRGNNLYLRIVHKQIESVGHGIELKSDVGQNSDQANDGDHDRHGMTLPISRRNEICDRC